MSEAKTWPSMRRPRVLWFHRPMCQAIRTKVKQCGSFQIWKQPHRQGETGMNLANGMLAQEVERSRESRERERRLEVYQEREKPTGAAWLGCSSALTLCCFSVVDFAVTASVAASLLPATNRRWVSTVGIFLECRQSLFWSEQRTQL